MSFTVDTSIWDKRIKEAQKLVPQKVPKLVQYAHDTVMKDVQRFVKGPYNPRGKGPGTGGIPIPRVSKRLAKSIQTVKGQTDRTIYIVSKGAIAPHNIWVHDGAKGTPPRKFIETPVETNKQKVLKYWDKEIGKEINKI